MSLLNWLMWYVSRPAEDIAGLTDRCFRWSPLPLRPAFPRPRRRHDCGLPPVPQIIELLEDRTLLTNFVVTSLEDPGAGGGSEPDGQLTLREAITAANTNQAFGDAAAGEEGGPDGVTDTITFDPSLFADGPVTITLDGQEFRITDDVQILGAGADQLVLDADGQSRVISVGEGAVVELADLTLTGGVADGELNEDQRGGGLFNEDGSVTLTRVNVVENQALNAGGGIYNAGTLSLVDSRVESNFAGEEDGYGFGLGGGIANTGELSLLRSRVLDNEATLGGGLHNRGTAELTGSTIADNTAEYLGGGIYNEAVGSGQPETDSSAEVTLIASTVSGNMAYEGGGGICNYGFGEGPVVSFAAAAVVPAGVNEPVEDGPTATLNVFNSTISGNWTWGAGGGIHNGVGGSPEGGASAVTNVSHSTITDNYAGSEPPEGGYGDYGGGGIFNGYSLSETQESTVRLESSIIAGNELGVIRSDFGVDLQGDFVSHGANLIGRIDGAWLSYPEALEDLDEELDQYGDSERGALDPGLGVLRNNGGPTETHALKEDSPAIDAGGPILGEDDLPLIPPLFTAGQDQRGLVRPAGAGVDVGAYELAYDFGDAPEPDGEGSGGGTLLENNGPRHVIRPGFSLGDSLDAETDGFPSPGADGDDLDSATGEDDEDGVLFISETLVPGGKGSFVVTANTGGLTEDEVAVVDVWIDYNGDGVFGPTGEPGEDPLADAEYVGTFLLRDGQFAILPDGTVSRFVIFDVPEGAVGVGEDGVTYARFRLRSETVAEDPQEEFAAARQLPPSAYGLAADGEVEDYRLQIDPDGDAALSIAVVAIGAKFHELFPDLNKEGGGLGNQPSTGEFSEDGDPDLLAASQFAREQLDALIQERLENPDDRVLVIVLDPVDFVTTDADGRQAGFVNGQESNDYGSGATHSGDGGVEVMLISNPSSGPMTMNLSGTGEYRVGAFVVDGQGNTEYRTASGLVNGNLSLTLDFGSDSVVADLIPVLDFGQDFESGLSDGLASFSNGQGSGDLALSQAALLAIASLDSENSSTGTAKVGNWIWHDVNGDGIQQTDESGLVGVLIELWSVNEDGTEELRATTRSFGRGNFLFEGLPEGDYFLKFFAPEGYEFTDADQGDDDTKDSDADAETGRTEVFHLADGEENMSIDAGFRLRKLVKLEAQNDDQAAVDGTHSKANLEVTHGSPDGHGGGGDVAPVVRLRSSRSAQAGIDFFWSSLTRGLVAGHGELARMGEFFWNLSREPHAAHSAGEPVTGSSADSGESGGDADPLVEALQLVRGTDGGEL